MSLITLEQLKKIMPLAGARAERFLAPLNAAMEEFEINTPLRQAAFLAQIAHESGQLRYVKELASGSAYDVGELAKRLGNTPEDDGDGEMYKGRGLVQITGVTNYSLCSVALFNDNRLLQHPELLEDPVNACRSACWFWKSRRLNGLADTGDFKTITKRINGGYTHQLEREKFYERAKVVLCV